MLEVFHTLAEVSVAVTGFSSLIIIFRGSAADWNRQDYVSFAFVLCWSIGCIFLSLLPIILVEFNVDLQTASQVGLFSAVAYIVIAGSILTKAQNSASRVGGGAIHQRTRIAMTIAFLVIVGGALSAGVGALPGQQHAWYATLILFLMLAATVNLGVFVVQATRQG